MRIRKTQKRDFSHKVHNLLVPNLIAIILLWLILAFIFFFINPGKPLILPFFFLIFFFAILSTISLFFRSKIQRLTISATLMAFLVLRYFGLLYFLNLFLLTSILITILIYERYAKKSN